MNIEPKSKLQIVHFLVKDVHMCIYLSEIKKVLPLVALGKVPSSPPYVAGLMNIEGKNITVIDLALQLGQQRSEKYSLSTPILLCSNGQKEIAIIVDNVLELSTLNKNKLQLHDGFNQDNSPFVGSLVYKSKTSLLINLNPIIHADITQGDNAYE